MVRKQARRQEMEPIAALAGVAAAMMEAARYTRGGLGTAGRRAARLGTGLRRYDHHEVMPAQAGIQKPYVQWQTALDE